MHKYIKKPVEIEAIQWTGDNTIEVLNFCPSCFTKNISGTQYNELMISTLEGPMKASVEDYIIKGIKSEFYACKPDVFELTYDKVTNLN